MSDPQKEEHHQNNILINVQKEDADTPIDIGAQDISEDSCKSDVEDNDSNSNHNSRNENQLLSIGDSSVENKMRKTV